jgi:carbon-monoxide dehydrogenase medium subunit
VKPPLFEYDLAGSVDEAVALLAEHGDEAKVLAGGQSLMPLLSLRLAHPERLVDVNRLTDLATIENGAGLRIGALVRHRVAERSDVVAAANPLLARALRFIGHAAIRNRGTIGGSIAHADPSAELPTLLVALDGEVEARSARGTRTVGAAELFDGFLTTTLQPDELLTAVRFPSLAPGTGWAFQEFSRRSGDFAIVGVACTLELDGQGHVAQARLAFSGVATTPTRASATEAALVGAEPSASVWTEMAQHAAVALDPPADLHGSSAYRRRLATTLVERALQEAHERARGEA